MHEKKWVSFANFPKLPRVDGCRLVSSSTVMVDGDIYLAGGRKGRYFKEHLNQLSLLEQGVQKI